MFNYFYGNEAEQYTFFRIPKVLRTDDAFSELSIESMFLYGLMLDRVSLSIKNNWIDEEGKIYIIFTIEEAINELKFGRNKVVKIISELEKIGLIEKKRQGLSKPNLIFVKDFATPLKYKKFENQTSRSLKIKLQEVSKSNSINTNITNTNIINTENQSVSQDIKNENIKQTDGRINTNIINPLNYENQSVSQDIKNENIKQTDGRINTNIINPLNYENQSVSQDIKNENIKQTDGRINTNIINPLNYENQSVSQDIKNENIKQTDGRINTNIINPLNYENQSVSQDIKNENIKQTDGRINTNIINPLNYEKMIKDNINYDWFVDYVARKKARAEKLDLPTYPDLKLVDDLIFVMLDVILSNDTYIKINGNEKNKDIVKSVFLKLEFKHIYNVWDNLSNQKEKIKNKRAYILTSLYNSYYETNLTQVINENIMFRN